MTISKHYDEILYRFLHTVVFNVLFKNTISIKFQMSRQYDQPNELIWCIKYTPCLCLIYFLKHIAVTVQDKYVTVWTFKYIY